MENQTHCQEIAAITEQKTDALFQYLRTVQELNARIRQLQISEELAKINREVDEVLRDMFFKETKH